MKRRKFDWRTPEEKQALAQHHDHLDQLAKISAAEIRYNAMVDTIVEIASVLASVRPAGHQIGLGGMTTPRRSSDDHTAPSAPGAELFSR